MKLISKAPFLLALSVLVLAGCQQMPRDNIFDPDGICVPQNVKADYYGPTMTDTISWDPVKNSQGYIVYKWDTMFSTWTAVRTNSSNTTTSIFYGVMSSGNKYRVSAKVGGMFSVLSDTAMSQ